MGGVGRNPTKPTLTTRPDYATLTSGCRWRRLRDSRLMYDFPIPSAVGLRFCRERGFASVGSHDPLVATPVLESDRHAVDEDGRRLLLGHGQEDHSDERDDAGRLR